ncbi:MAG: protoglobin domain-containing protein [Pirellulaceae bacterium]
MRPADLFQRYLDLQDYVAWREEDAEWVRSAGRVLRPYFDELIDDFYSEIQRHPEAARVITGGDAQIARLKTQLRGWLVDLFQVRHDEDYVWRRWRTGLRHVEIGLHQIYTNVALARLRTGMLRRLFQNWRGDAGELQSVVEALNKVVDLDLALIEDAYESEHMQRLQQAERQRMEQTVHREREFSEGLLQHAQAIVLVLDTEGRIVRFNSYLEQLSGYRLEDVCSRDWFELFLPPEEREPLRETFQSMLEGEETTTEVNRIVCRQGGVRDISWSNKVLKDPDGRTTAVLAIGQDITELKEAQQRALQSERLAAIGQMVAGLAHESRNALQRIQANAEMLELEVEENKDAMALVQRIQNAQDQLHRLFDEVRGYAAPINLDRVPCTLSELWREAWDILARQRAERQTRLNEQTQLRDLNVMVDRFRMVQVFRNLLENSLAACSDPVEISIDVNTARFGQQELLRVVVRDNGPGIAADARERIFQPFFTTKTKGTGLGMSIAQRIVEAHGGTIAVLPNSRGGAAVEFFLPRPSR